MDLNLTTSRLTSPLWFFIPVAIIYAAAIVIVTNSPSNGHPQAVSYGLTIDLVVLVPLVFYLVMVRKRGWALVTVVPVFLLSFGAALLVVPDADHQLLDSIAIALPIMEVILVSYVGVRAFQLIKANRSAKSSETDFYDGLRKAVGEVFDTPAVVNALSYEMAIFYYALSWRPSHRKPEGLAYHRRSGYGAVVGAVLMIAIFELAAIHFLLRSWSTVATVIHAVISVYGFVWLVGDYRAMKDRPHEIASTGIRIRNGLRWEIEITWKQIVSVRRVRKSPEKIGYLNAVPIGEPKYLIELNSGTKALGPYGIERTVTRVGLTVDDELEFETRLRSYGVDVEH